MKTLLVVVLVVLAGLFLYNYATRGEFTLVPGFLLTDGEKQVESLQRRFESVQRALKEAGQTATISGTDMTAEVQAAKREADRLQKELRDRMAKLDAKARAKADTLRRAIEAFQRELNSEK